MKLKLIAFVLILSSCTVEQKITRKLRKSDRLRKEAIMLGAHVRSDTVWTSTTHILPGEKTTVTLHDTTQTTVYQDKIRIEYRHIHDSVRIHVQCPSDTIRIKVPVAVMNEVICPPVDHTWRTVALILIGILTVCGLFLGRR